MDIQAIVDDFWAERAKGIYYPPQWFDRLTLDQAYRVQLGLLDKSLAAGARHVGWKVGLTAAAIREQFRVHEPVFGYLLESGRAESGAEIDLADWQGPGFENELCLRLGKDLRGPGVDVAAARAAVNACHPAMELVENRGDFTAQLAIAVADNVQQRSFVVGPRIPLAASADLVAIECTSRLNGAEVARAKGVAVMGNPYESDSLAGQQIGPIRPLAGSGTICDGRLVYPAVSADAWRQRRNPFQRHRHGGFAHRRELTRRRNQPIHDDETTRRHVRRHTDAKRES